MTKKQRIAVLEKQVADMAAQILALQLAQIDRTPAMPPSHWPTGPYLPLHDNTNPLPPGVFPWTVMCGGADRTGWTI